MSLEMIVISSSTSIHRVQRGMTLNDSSEKLSGKSGVKIMDLKDPESTKSFFKSANFDRMLNISDDVFFFKFKTENFDELDENELKELGEKCSSNSVVVFLKSQFTRKFSIYWKLKDLNYFFALKLYNENYSHDMEIYEFTADFFVESLRAGHVGFQPDLLSSEKVNNISIFDLVDSRGYNLLFLAGETGNMNLTKNLFRLGLDPKSHEDDVCVLDLAAKNGHYDLIISLYAENAPLPSSIDANTGSDDFKSFIKLLNDFYKMIKIDNLKKVKKIIEKLPRTNHFYVPTNESALKVAVENKSFDSYEFFISEKLRFAPHESPEIYYEELLLHEQVIVREIHTKYVQELQEKHINVLISKSFISHDVPDAKEKLKFLHQAYESLNKDEFIRIILKIVAASKNIKIIFDFNRETVNIANPTEDSTTEGVFYTTGRIYIGAVNLLSEEAAHKTLAVIAHELCHFAINLVYNNHAKPYKVDDRKAIEEFDKISKFCEENKGKESVIDCVYESYLKGMHHAELIVRVPHLLAMYRTDNRKITRARDNFEHLFDFFEKKTVPDMMEALKLIDVEPENIINKQDKKISSLKKVSRGLGLLSVLGIIGAFIVGFAFYNPDRSFHDLSRFEQSRVQNGPVLYKNVAVKFQDLFPQNSSAYEKLSYNHISLLLSGQTLTLCDSHFHYLEELVKHDWKNLTQKLKDKVLSSNFTFQNESLKLEEFHNLYPDVFDALSSNQISNILDNKQLKVHHMIKNETKFYVERKLWEKHVDEIYYAYMQFMHGGTTPCQCSCYNVTGSTKTFEMFYEEFKNKSIDAQARMLYEMRNRDDYKVCSLRDYRIRINSYPFEATDTLLTHKSFLLGFEEILRKANETKLFILSAEAGTGKRTTFQSLAVRAKKKFPTRWVSYINLKDHMNLYRDVKTMEDVRKMLEYIFALSSKNTFEKKIFDRFFESGRVMLFWKGLAEICSDHIKPVLNILSLIKENTDNIQFLCTRPLHAVKLVSETYTLIPYTREEQEIYLRKFLVSQQIDDEKISNYVQKVQKIVRLTKLKEGFDTPLLLKMIAELISNDVEVRENENLYEIYEKFVNEKIRMWMNKSDDAKKLSMISMTSDFRINILYQQYAMKGEFQSNDHAYKFAYFNSLKLKLMREEVPNELTNDEISRMGILHISCAKSFKFVQRTFAEFFVAQYFVESIFIARDDLSDEQAEQRIKVFYHIFSYPFMRVRSFIRSFLQTKKAKESKLFKSTISRIFKTKFQRLYFNSLKEFGETPLLEFFAKDHNVLTDLLQIERNETLYTASFNYAYFSGMKYGEVYHSRIKDFGKKHLTEKEYEQFVDHKNQKGVILFSIYCLKRKILDAEIHETQVSHDRYVFHLMTLENDDPFYAFEIIVNQLTKDELRELLTSEIILNSFTIHSRVTSILNDKVWNLIEDNLALDEQKRLIAKFFGTKLILEDTNTLNFVLNKLEKFYSNEEIYELLSSTTILHSGATFQPLWNFFINHTTQNQQKVILRQAVQDECFSTPFTAYEHSKHCYAFPPLNILQSSLFSFDGLSSFNEVAKIYKTYFNKIELQEIIFSGSTEFLPFVIIQGDHNLCAGFIEYLKKVFDRNEKFLQNYLLKEIELTNLNAFEFLNNFSDPKNCLELFSKLLEYTQHD